MKIGILTLPLHTNIGGILQAYALQTVLNSLGHDAYILDKSNYNKLTFRKALKRIIKKYIFCKSTDDFQIISQNVKRFIDQYIHRIDVYDYNKLQESDWDALVVGSDQIWRREFSDHIQTVYFDFARDWKQVKRIAYAPSFGLDKWDYSSQETVVCAQLIKKFDLVTVRESAAVTLCKEHLDIEAKHVLDPTMLLMAQDYQILVEKSGEPKSDGDMLVYLMDYAEQHYQLVDVASDSLHLKPFFVFSKVDRTDLPAEERIQIPIECWLRGFMDAKFVITDSFHACAFSIIFNVPFVVLKNDSGGMSRIRSLLSQFGLEDRLVEDAKSISQLKPIDWSRVNQIRNIHKSEALSMLSEVLQ